MAYKDLIGQVFGRLTVIKELKERGKNRDIIVEFLCECWEHKNIPISRVVRGDTKSCGCIYKESRYRIRTPKGQPGFNKLYSSYKREGEERGYVFDLNKDEFKELTSSECYYCNDEPSKTISYTQNKISTETKEHGRYTYNGVDRVNNSIGYNVENCVPCCTTCNIMKRALGEKEFYNHIIKIYNHIKTRVSKTTNK